MSKGTLKRRFGCYRIFKVRDKTIFKNVDFVLKFVYSPEFDSWKRRKTYKPLEIAAYRIFLLLKKCVLFLFFRVFKNFFQRVLDKLEVEYRTLAKITSKERVEKNIVDKIALREAVINALINALIHRDYLELGSEVHIDIFDDRLEIYSPGGMYDGSFVQERDIDKIFNGEFSASSKRVRFIRSIRISWAMTV